MNEPEYVTTVLAAYVALPDTACRPRHADRALAQQLAAEGVSIQVVLDALLLAHTRRHAHPDASPPPVRSLHYFLPVIRELASVDPAVLTYLHDSLHRRLNPAPCPAPTPATTSPAT